jgi:putative endonuclease
MAKTNTNRVRKAAAVASRGGMDCFVYMLGHSDKNGYRTYVGWTLDLDRRLAQHNSGKGARSTRGRTWVLLHVERFATRNEAMSREWHLKRDRLFRKLLAQKIIR